MPAKSGASLSAVTMKTWAATAIIRQTNALLHTISTVIATSTRQKSTPAALAVT